MTSNKQDNICKLDLYEYDKFALIHVNNYEN